MPKIARGRGTGASRRDVGRARTARRRRGAVAARRGGRGRCPSGRRRCGRRGPPAREGRRWGRGSWRAACPHPAKGRRPARCAGATALQPDRSLVDDVGTWSPEPSRRQLQASAASYRSFADATRAVLDLLEQQIPDVAVFLAHLDRSHEIHRIVDARNGAEFGLRSNLALPLVGVLLRPHGRQPRAAAVQRRRPATRSTAGRGPGALRRRRLPGRAAGALRRLARRLARRDVARARPLPRRPRAAVRMLARVLAYELERETNERDLRRLNDSLRSQARGMAAVARAARALAGDGDPRPRCSRPPARRRRAGRLPARAVRAASWCRPRCTASTWRP